MAEPMFHVYVDNKGRVLRTDDELLAHLHGMTRAKEEYRIDYMNTSGECTRVGSGERDCEGTWRVTQTWNNSPAVCAGCDCENIAERFVFLSDDDDE